LTKCYVVATLIVYNYTVPLVTIYILGEKMNLELVEKIKSNPKYHELVSKRNSFSLKLSLFVLAMFYSYILVIAFDKELLATKIGDGVMTYAFPVGAAIIIISFITTLIYVNRANGEFEDLTNEIKKQAMGGK
jgi:uncharacterized membrane protein (DUF485 family)